MKMAAVNHADLLHNTRCTKPQEYRVKLESYKNARGHMMPPPLHLSDIRCKCFPIPALPWQAKGAKNERTNKGVYVGC